MVIRELWVHVVGLLILQKHNRSVDCAESIGLGFLGMWCTHM